MGGWNRLVSGWMNGLISGWYRLISMNSTQASSTCVHIHNMYIQTYKCTFVHVLYIQNIQKWCLQNLYRKYMHVCR